MQVKHAPFSKSIVTSVFKDMANGNASGGQEVMSEKISSTSVVQVNGLRTYLYSAILRNSPKPRDTENTQENLVLLGWQHKDEQFVEYNCCLWLHNGEIISVGVTKTKSKTLRVTLKATEFLCSVIPWPAVRAVSMAMRRSRCPHRTEAYIKPYVQGPEQSGLAVCSNIAYWSLDAKYLVEWFEIVRLIGVSKVIAYTHELNEGAMEVLRYYEMMGYAEVYAFDYPEKDALPRKINEKINQCFQDLSVVMLDCTERLSNYQYVTVMDKDELIVPGVDRLQGALLDFLETQMKQTPLVGALTFQTQIHNITGTPLVGNAMYTDYCSHCSPPMMDRWKNIYLPRRIVPGSISSHKLSTIKGYGRIYVPPGVAVIHHYRIPRSAYTVERIQVDYNANCTVMTRLAELIKDSTRKIRSQLGLI